MTTIDATTYQARQTEAEFQAAVIDAAKLHGWLCVHVRQMLGNDPGIPDLLMWRNNDYLLIELKTEKGVVSPKQQRWHDAAAAHGVTVHVLRPSDWSAVEELLRGE